MPSSHLVAPWMLPTKTGHSQLGMDFAVHSQATAQYSHVFNQNCPIDVFIIILIPHDINIVVVVIVIIRPVCLCLCSSQ